MKILLDTSLQALTIAGVLCKYLAPNRFSILQGLLQLRPEKKELYKLTSKQNIGWSKNPSGVLNGLLPIYPGSWSTSFPGTFIHNIVSICLIYKETIHQHRNRVFSNGFCHPVETKLVIKVISKSNQLIKEIIDLQKQLVVFRMLLSQQARKKAQHTIVSTLHSQYFVACKN